MFVSSRSVLSRVIIFVTPWTVALQAPLSTGFPRQDYWNALSSSPPGDLPDPGIELSSPTSPDWSVVGLNPSEWHPYRKTAI